MAGLLTRPDGRHLLIRMLFRPFSSQGDSLERNVEIFDRVLKGKQRERAAWLRNAQDPLLSSVADNLLDRLDDCRRKFPTALNLGGALDFTKQLLKNRGGIEMLLMMDMSENMLKRSLKMDPCNENRLTCSYMPIIADEEFLPLKPQSLDLVLSCLGLHWVNDLAGMMIQCRMAMKPDGLFLASMFGGETLRELRIACTLAQLEREGGISPRVSPFAQVRDAGNLLIRAGLALPAVDVEEYTMKYPSALALIEHLRSMGETNALLKRSEILKKETAIAAAAIYESMFGESDGTVPATFEVIYMAGWSPDPSQPRPKRRGSGTVSFDELHKVFGDHSS